MGIFSKELYSKNDLKLIERFKEFKEDDFIQITCFVKTDYSKMIKEDLPVEDLQKVYMYDAVHFVENIDCGGKSYFGHLFTRGSADAMRTIMKSGVSVQLLMKYLNPSIGRVEVKKESVNKAEEYAKFKKDDNRIDKFPDDHLLLYTLSKHGMPLIDYLQRHSTKADKIYYQIGVMMAELQKGNIVQVDFGPHNMIIVDDKLKIIDLYDPRRTDHPCTLLKIDEIDEKEHSLHLIRGLNALFYRRILEIFDGDSRYGRKRLINKMVDGFGSIKNNPYNKFTLDRIDYRD
ncbi:hypothetical protein ACFLQI_03170, partial [Candidatus Undinarchaeota archaeon]